VTLEERIQALSSVSGVSMSRRRLVLSTLAGIGTLSVASLLAACGDDDDDDEPAAEPVDDDTDEDPADEDDEDDDEPDEPAGDAPSGEVIVSQPLEIRNLDSSMWAGNYIQSATLHVMEPLVRRMEDLEIHPFLAEQWEFLDDTTLQFTLRDDVTFHNGDQFVADDVVATYVGRVFGPDAESAHARFTATIDEVEAVDDQTVVMRLSQPDARLLGRIALVGIAPRGPLEDLGDEEFDASPIGTGPFTLENWDHPQQTITFVNYPDYWGGQAQLERVTFRSILEDSTRVAELLTGGIDLAVNVPSHMVPEVDQSGVAEIKHVTSLRTIFAFLNTHHPPFDDIRMRQAVNFGIDKAEIVEGVLDGFGLVNHQLCPPVVLGYVPELDGYYDFDPERARSLIDEAGYGDGLEVNYYYPPGRYLKGDEVVANIVDQLDRIGITVNVQALEFQTYLEDYMNQLVPECHIGMWSNANDTMELDYNLEINVHSRSRGHYWGSPEVDAAIDDAVSTLDAAEREQKWQALAREMVEEAVWIFLYNQDDIYGVSTSVQNWEPRPDEIYFLGNARKS
jgi:peptide/nickel transport system substrate-binding protein